MQGLLLNKSVDIISLPVSSVEHFSVIKPSQKERSLPVNFRLISLCPETIVCDVLNNRVLKSSYDRQPRATAIASVVSAVPGASLTKFSKEVFYTLQ
jgi:hypothetical protein